MKIYVAAYTDQGIRSIVTEHGGETLHWETSPYSRASRIDGARTKMDPENDLVFREINAFMATLPKERQQAIWDAYVEIHQIFEDNFDPLAKGQGRMQLVVKRIYDLVPYQEIHDWATMASIIHLPLNLKTHYGDKDPIDRTYLRQDYFDLTVMAIALRFMVPIWGEYIPRLKDDVDNDFKEYTAVMLLYRTYITTSAPYQRLRVYIESWISSMSTQGNVFSALLAGLSSEKIPDWLLACTLVRRTSVVPIASESEGPNIITDVYQYVYNTMGSPGHKRFNGPVSEKTVRKDEKSDQQESLAESYKIKQQVSDGEVVAANVYVTDYVEDMTRSIDPTADLSKLNECLQSLRGLDHLVILQHHVTLTQWVLTSAISPHFIPLLSRNALLHAMASAQALLWHWGFTDLAALLSAREARQLEDEFVSAQESRARIPNDVLNELVAIYSYSYPVKGKLVTPKQSNPGSRAVDAFYQLVASSDWYLNAPKALVAHTHRIPGSRKMYVPVDIRVQLAKLLIHLYHQRIAFNERSRLAAFPLRDS